MGNKTFGLPYIGDNFFKNEEDPNITEIMDYGFKSDMEKIRELIKNGMDINITKKGPNNYNLLMCAQTPEVAKELIALGVNIDYIYNNVHKLDVLHYFVAVRSKIDILKVLLSSGINVNNIYSGNTNIIFEICRFTSNSDTPIPTDLAIEMIKLIVDCKQYKGDINLLTYYNQTSLSKALEYKNFELAEFLVSIGADINIKTNFTDLLFLCNCIPNKINTVNFLLKHGVNRHILDSWYNSPLYYAVKLGHTDIVNSLLKTQEI